MEKTRVGVSPHLRQEESTRGIMLDVLIALSPAVLWGGYVFGLRSLVLTALSVFCCVALEWICQRWMNRPVTISDLSATVTGVLLAMNLPVSVPFWLIPIGAFFAIAVTKQLFGGLGKNFVNPVLVARAVLFISFPTYMNRFTEPFFRPDALSPSLGREELADAITSATPLKGLKDGVLPTDLSWADLVMGNYAGCIGEVSSLILLAGFLYLLLRRTVTWHVPISFLGTVAALTYFFPRGEGDALEFMGYSLLTGGLFLGAIFMATDYVTCPVTRGGKLVYGVICGSLTILIRYFGGYSEGVSFAILVANLLVWYLDRWFMPRAYGTPLRLFGRDKEAKK